MITTGKEGCMASLQSNKNGDATQFKLQALSTLQGIKEGKFNPLSEKKSINPFCSDIRHFKTVFDISDSEAMMDFGVWILSRCEERKNVCIQADHVLESFYELMRRETDEGESLTIIIEESFEEIFISMQFQKSLHPHPSIERLLQLLPSECVISDTSVYVRLLVHDERGTNCGRTLKIQPSLEVQITKPSHALSSEAKELLRHTFVEKNNAREYVQDLGGDVLDEIRDLASADAEWKQCLSVMENGVNLQRFAERVLGMYAGTLNNLFEFTALGYALSSLGDFLKTQADNIMSDPLKQEKLLMLLENLGEDLASWRNHIFIEQDSNDIHYLDSSFFSSCMQIEEIMSDQAITVDDNNDIEFF
jgi:hypothetical protein